MQCSAVQCSVVVVAVTVQWTLHLKRQANTRASCVRAEPAGVASWVAAQYRRNCAGLHRMRAYSCTAVRVCGFLGYHVQY
jgi:hypothetical protein